MTTASKMTKFRTRAEGGSIRIFSGHFAAHYNAGSGDGSYTVVVDLGREFEEEGPGWKFVDSFEVGGPGVFLSLTDYGDDEAFEFPEGRWFVSHQRDARIVHVEYRPR